MYVPITDQEGPANPIEMFDFIPSAKRKRISAGKVETRCSDCAESDTVVITIKQYEIWRRAEGNLHFGKLIMKDWPVGQSHFFCDKH